MFTGIVEKIGRVTTAETVRRELKLRIQTGWTDLMLGESIAVNGVCLTVAECSARNEEALFFLSEETLARSNLGTLQAQSRVNLERAVLASTRLSGHIVQGHVDGLARLDRFSQQGESYTLEFLLPDPLARYCIEKGSIALDGTSLTINQIQGSRIFITMIPHTWKNTRFSDLGTGDQVNVEVDVIAKYTEKLCQPYLKH